MIVYLKLFYLYLCYWFVGLTEEDFQYSKAVYLSQLGFYHSAIHALKKAERELKTVYVYGLLGWCYLQIEAYDKALPYYQKAYASDDSPAILVGLAASELHAGSIQLSREYYQRLLSFRNDPIMDQCLKRLEMEYDKRTSLS